MSESTEITKPEERAVAPVTSPNPERIRLGDLKVSDLNPRHDATDTGVISIDSIGLIQPITLWCNEGGKLEVLVGSRRYRHLLATRRQNGFLEPHEYSIKEGPRDVVSLLPLWENRDRENVPPATMARHYVHLKESVFADRDQKTMANELGCVDEGTLSNFIHLARDIDRLPKSWQGGLNSIGTTKSSIGLGHYSAVKKLLPKDGDELATDLIAFLNKAVSQKWAVKKLRKEAESFTSQSEPEGSSANSNNSAILEGKNAIPAETKVTPPEDRNVGKPGDHGSEIEPTDSSAEIPQDSDEVHSEDIPPETSTQATLAQAEVLQSLLIDLIPLISPGFLKDAVRKSIDTLGLTATQELADAVGDPRFVDEVANAKGEELAA